MEAGNAARPEDVGENLAAVEPPPKKRELPRLFWSDALRNFFRIANTER